jgi:hypothetical protein
MARNPTDTAVWAGPGGTANLISANASGQAAVITKALYLAIIAVCVIGIAAPVIIIARLLIRIESTVEDIYYAANPFKKNPDK